MRKSLGYTKPKGEVKVKVYLSRLRCDPGFLVRKHGYLAQHQLVPCFFKRGDARAHMLRPERW